MKVEKCKAYSGLRLKKAQKEYKEDHDKAWHDLATTLHGHAKLAK